MKCTINTIKCSIAIISIFSISGCILYPPLNLSLAKERVKQYYENGQYEKDLNKIIDRALSYFKKIPVTPTAAVIFDVDDTLLSDYCDVKEISFGYIPKLYHWWVQRADAPSIKPTKRLYDYLVNRGFRIIILTGRKYNEYDATIKNLTEQGFNHFDKLIVRQKDEENLAARTYKTRHRKQLIDEGYTIVGNIGDQWSDLGFYSGYQVKLPNVIYTIP